MASLHPISAASLRISTSESTRTLVPDYFSQPICSEEGADAAYQKYLEQSADRGLGFGHWLEAEARRLMGSRS
jgi:hypothetical protein